MLKNIDLLGITPSLMIKKDTSFKTNSGAILTIFMVVASTLAFVAFGRDIVEKKYPNVNMKKDMNPAPSLNFSGVNNTYIFTVYDGTKNVPIPDLNRIFRMVFYYQDVDPDRGNSGGKTVIETGHEVYKCESDQITDEIKSYLLFPYENYFCFPKNLTLPLRGVVVTGKNNIFKLNVEFCQNTTSNGNSCFSTEEIISILPSTFNYHYVMDDYYMASGDYNNPGKRFYYNGLTRSSYGSMSRIWNWFKNIEYITDTGWILEDLRYENFVSLDRAQPEIYVTPGNAVVFSHFFSMIHLKEIYFRTYIKLPGVFANIGGFITFFKVLLSLINSYITQPFLLELFQDALINGKYEDGHKETKSLSKISLNTIHSNLPSNLNVIKNTSGSKFNGNRRQTTSGTQMGYVISTSQIDKNKMIHQKLNFSKCEAIFRFLKCGKKLKHNNQILFEVNKVYKKMFSVETMTILFNKVNSMDDDPSKPFENNKNHSNNQLSNQVSKLRISSPKMIKSTQKRIIQASDKIEDRPEGEQI